jgi:hypothetical protein
LYHTHIFLHIEIKKRRIAEKRETQNRDWVDLLLTFFLEATEKDKRGERCCCSLVFLPLYLSPFVLYHYFVLKKKMKQVAMLALLFCLFAGSFAGRHSPAEIFNGALYFVNGTYVVLSFYSCFYIHAFILVFISPNKFREQVS